MPAPRPRNERSCSATPSAREDAWCPRMGSSNGVGKGRVNQPYLFRREDGGLLLMAGLRRGERFVVLTERSNEAVAEIHDRMPVLSLPRNAPAIGSAKVRSLQLRDEANRRFPESTASKTTTRIASVRSRNRASSSTDYLDYEPPRLAFSTASTSIVSASARSTRTRGRPREESSARAASLRDAASTSASTPS